MNNKLIAFAIALAPALALADDSTVSMYGKISVGVETAKADGATNPTLNIKSRARVTEQASYIGFRGLEPLGGSLNAFFQIESLVKPDSPPGRTTVSTTAFASRNNGVGLRGEFGEIMLGRWDTYYTNHVPAGDTLFIKSSYSATVLSLFGGTAGLGGLVSALGSGNANEGRGLTDFGGRRNDVVRYLTPKFGGFTGKLTYVAPEATTEYTATSPAVIAGLVNPGKAKDEGLELSLTYLNPNIGFFNASYYKRKDFLGVVSAAGSVGA
ncbi:MAG: porin, partial [Burkholderiales bacterium]|nr:porin [Burkholderiales bacterium]